jgi:hypothetical protein
MTEVMKTAIELDERLVNENEEKLQSLLVENRGLKEMLKIRTKYGAVCTRSHEPTSVEPCNVNGSNLIDQEVQTDDLAALTTVDATSAQIIVPFQLDETSEQDDSRTDEHTLNAEAAAAAVESMMVCIEEAQNDND